MDGWTVDGMDFVNQPRALVIQPIYEDQRQAMFGNGLDGWQIQNDDLQEVITALNESDIDIPLNFVNMKKWNILFYIPFGDDIIIGDQEFHRKVREFDDFV